METILTSWVLLCLIGGAVDALGQLLCKRAWAPPPYIIVGTLGIMWFMCPLLLMLFGPASFMTVGQAAALGAGALVPAVLVGVMFWVDNLTRFDANNKAPFVGYVIVVVEISAMATAFLLELLIKTYRGATIDVTVGHVVGVFFALFSIAYFWSQKFADEKAAQQKKARDGVVAVKTQPFIPLNWIALSVITGVLSGLGGIFYKEDPAVPAYVFTGIIGGAWMICSAIFMGGRVLWRGAGLRLNILGFREAKQFGPIVFGSLVLAGVLTWGANMGRFSAINNAPLIGYVYLLFPIAAGVVALLLEGLAKRLRGEALVWGHRELIGTVFALGALAAFTLA